MLAGLEFIVAACAIGAGIILFAIALKRRSPTVLRRGGDAATGTILKTNLFALTVIGLIFFGTGFLVDAFM